MGLGHSLWQYSGEQRRKQRFPVECELIYKALGNPENPIAGVGRTVNLSSSGILFTSEQPIDVGQQMELSINWPSKLEGKHRLLLIVTGSVIRNDAGRTAIETQRHDFRIRGSAALRAFSESMTTDPGIRRASPKAS